VPEPAASDAPASSSAAPSVWWTEAGDEPARAPFRGEGTADLVIVGGGLTGISSAYHFARRFPGLGIVLLEARRLAGGASGRSGGQVLHWINGMPADTEERARRVWEVSGAGIDLVEELARLDPVPDRNCGFVRDGGLEIYTDERRADEGRKRSETLKNWGLPLEWLDGAALAERLRMPRAVGAMLDPLAGRVNGVLLVRAVARAAEAAGVRIHEGSRVLRIEEGETHTVHTAAPGGAGGAEERGGIVRCKQLVLATNAWTPTLGYFRSGIVALHSHVVASAAHGEAQRRALGFGRFAGFNDDMDRIAYGTLSPGGRFVYGGGSNGAYGYLWGNRAEWPGTADKGFDAVMRHLRKSFPEAASEPFAQRWSGALGVTMNRMLAVGRRGAHDNVSYALGYSGHGLALATLAGRMLADLHAGEGGSWADLPFWNREPGGIPPEPFRWAGYHVFTALTGKSPRKQG
jgi:glycine/D-amino acid oxidase-like deaminating enzyme